MFKKLIKNKKGSELIEKILKVAVSLSIGAVVIGTTWGIVNSYTNSKVPNYQGNISVSQNSWKSFKERFNKNELDYNNDGVVNEFDGEFVLGEIFKLEPHYDDDIMATYGEMRLTEKLKTNKIIVDFWSRCDFDGDGSLNEGECNLASYVFTSGGNMQDAFVRLIYDYNNATSEPLKREAKNAIVLFPKDEFPRPEGFPF